MLQFDFFRKVNEDIQSTTSSGGIFSMVAGLCGLILFIYEYNLYMGFETGTHLFIDSNFDEDFTMHLNVTFTEAPCDVLSIDQEDLNGSRQNSYHNNLQFIPLDKYGQKLPKTKQSENYLDSEQELDDVIEKVKTNQQCLVYGSVNLRKTPGFLQFGFRERSNLVSRIQRKDQNLFKKLDIDFRINSIVMGEFDNVEKKYQKSNTMHNFFRSKKKMSIMELYDIEEESLDPYRGLEISKQGKQDFLLVFDILPIQMQRMSSKSSDEIYQYSLLHSSQNKNENEQTMAYLRYGINSVTIQYYKKSKPFYHFVVNILAIVGGIFSVVGLLYKVYNTITDQVFKKLK